MGRWGRALIQQAIRKNEEAGEGLLGKACEKLERAIKIKADNWETCFDCGYAFCLLASVRDNIEAEALFKRACDKFEMALKIEPANCTVLSYLGYTLSRWAERKDGEEAKELFAEAHQKYEQAAELKPDDFANLNSWGGSLLEQADKETGKKRKDLLEEARKKFLKAEDIKQASGAYNLACMCGLEEDEDGCRRWLEIGEDAGSLPNRERAMTDDDLESVRDKEWFAEIRWGSGER